jgi:hypothetical protein
MEVIHSVDVIDGMDADIDDAVDEVLCIEGSSEIFSLARCGAAETRDLDLAVSGVLRANRIW